MGERPTLETERLVLRPFTAADGHEVQRLAGDREVASGTANLPHPYEDGMAEQWISGHQEKFERGEAVTFAILTKAQSTLVGAISLANISKRHLRAELGYWIGRPYWGLGYCTEAAQAIIEYGFSRLKLNRIHGGHFSRNPASGRVMQKAGMKHEGCRRQHVEKWGVYEDVELYGILKSEWEQQGGTR